jgi:pyrroloquinoline quinone (PQQ) biosynthesis protein C
MSIFDGLNAAICAHPAWDNAFFRRANDVSLAQLRKVVPEYLYFTSRFPAILGQLVARVDGGAQFYLVSILYSELGSGKESEAHANLFRRLCRDIGVAQDKLNGAPRLQGTKDLTEGLYALYRDEPLAQSLGAQYALEFQADHMLKSFRRAFAVVDTGGSGRAPEGMFFFKLHETEEPDHIASMTQIIARYIQDDRDLASVLLGARQCLDLFAEFWSQLLVDIQDAPAHPEILAS